MARLEVRLESSSSSSAAAAEAEGEGEGEVGRRITLRAEAGAGEESAWAAVVEGMRGLLQEQSRSQGEGGSDGLGLRLED